VLVPAPKGSPSRPFSAEEHEARFAQELSSRISHQRCAEIVAIRSSRHVAALRDAVRRLKNGTMKEQLFERGVFLGHCDERDEMLREQLAKFLHDRHERTLGDKP